jgi:hypothetical protein
MLGIHSDLLPFACDTRRLPRFTILVPENIIRHCVVRSSGSFRDELAILMQSRYRQHAHALSFGDTGY